MTKPYYNEKGITIYHEDCFLISEELIAETETVLSDPQYGIGFKTNAKRSRNDGGLNFAKHSPREIDRDPAWKPLKGNDRIPFDATRFLHFREVILWGGNNYALPPSRGWLVWDKLKDKTPTHFGDCELAWTNIDMSIRIWRQLWRGMVREGEENLSNGPKLHPCQKPVALMQWCLGFSKCSGTVLDPQMGSGTTLLAAKRLGRPAIGIESEECHCETAARRLRQEVLQL
jgi:site-specific DNA-methyltransferase (adenine-specific)